jgi:hypothetical protein
MLATGFLPLAFQCPHESNASALIHQLPLAHPHLSNRALSAEQTRPRVIWPVAYVALTMSLTFVLTMLLYAQRC